MSNLLATLSALLAQLTGHVLVHDALGVVACLGWALGALGLGLVARKLLHAPVWLARRIVVLGANLWIVPAFYWIHLWPAGWLPVAVLLYANHWVQSRHALPSLQRDGETAVVDLFGHQWSLLIVQIFLWWQGDQFMAMAGFVALGVGDSAAEIVGRRWGKNHFRFRGGRHKTFEGSLAMLIATFVAVVCINSFFAKIPDVWFPGWVTISAILTALVATVLELYTPRKYEDFLVGLLPAFFMYYYTVAGFR